MVQNRIETHPILKIERKETLQFYWKDKVIESYPGETIASALIANGIDIFGHHPKDNAALGIFCANGQCSQCMVILDGLPVKACMTFVKSNSQVLPSEGLPELPTVMTHGRSQNYHPPAIKKQVLIIGGGPAGLSAAVELGKLNLSVLLIDDKHKLGGKLVLQTHRFFGSYDTVYAGTRGIDIAEILEKEITKLPSVEVWTNATAVAVFEDKSIGIWQNQTDYKLVYPEELLVATGAREKSLAFAGNTLPSVFGAGAFQTLVNRDLVRPSSQLFIVGGGNVGLIAGYHALQAGINVVGLIEALPECGGYKVHKDKLARLGVPILTSHTVISANGKNHVESITLAEVTRDFKPIQGTEKTYPCDCILIAVGLDPVNEFINKAKEMGIPVHSAGDAMEIAEASAAIFSGKIKGLEIAQNLGISVNANADEWLKTEGILKSKPGQVHQRGSEIPGDVFPVMHCTQEIPCDPCAHVCPNHLIQVEQKDIRKLPEFCVINEKNCIACERCVAICPGLAITLVDFRKDHDNPIVTIPFEFSKADFSEGNIVKLTDVEGNLLGEAPIVKIRQIPAYPGTVLIRVKTKPDIATLITGIRLIDNFYSGSASDEDYSKIDDETYICRCERITAGEIRKLIREGVRDINQIKAVTKLSMGACGGKTCLQTINTIFRQEGVPISDITPTTIRPLFVEIPVSVLCGYKTSEDDHAEA